MCYQNPNWRGPHLLDLDSEKQEFLILLDMITSSDANALQTFWMCNSCKDGASEVKPRIPWWGRTGQTLQGMILFKETQRLTGKATCREASLKLLGDFGMWLEFFMETASNPLSLPAKKRNVLKKIPTFNYVATMVTKEKTQHTGCWFPLPPADFQTLPFLLS